MTFVSYIYKVTLLTSNYVVHIYHSQKANNILYSLLIVDHCQAYRLLDFRFTQIYFNMRLLLYIDNASRNYASFLFLEQTSTEQ